MLRRGVTLIADAALARVGAASSSAGLHSSGPQGAAQAAAAAAQEAPQAEEAAVDGTLHGLRKRLAQGAARIRRRDCARPRAARCSAPHVRAAHLRLTPLPPAAPLPSSRPRLHRLCERLGAQRRRLLGGGAELEGAGGGGGRGRAVLATAWTT